MSTDTKSSSRIQLFDLMRGLSVILMVFYHGVFFWWWLDYASHFWLDPFSLGWIVVARAALIGFILTAGAVAALGSSHQFDTAGLTAESSKVWRRLGVLGGLAALFTILTLLIIPSAPIWFGVLHFFTVMTLLQSFLRAAGSKFLLVSTVLICILWLVRMSAGIPPGLSALLSSPVWWPLGIVVPQVAMLDYVPLFPWMAWYLVGMLVGRYAEGNDWQHWSFSARWQRAVRWVGRWSLWIYVLHIPLVWGVLQVVRTIDLSSVGIPW